jgi:hypothetical protein
MALNLIKYLVPNENISFVISKDNAKAEITHHSARIVSLAILLIKLEETWGQN